jgi:Mg-chelatase subunit ChlD
MFRLINYWPLGLLIFIPYVFYISIKSLADLSPWRRWSSLILRSLVLILLVLSLAGFMLVLKVDRLCVIFALDTSNSIPESESQRALGFIKKSLENMKDTDQSGLIVFGGEAYVQVPPKITPTVSKIMSVPSPDYTNIEKAVKTAIDLFPNTLQKKIVLISDGNENAGNVINQIPLLKSSGVQIYTVPLSTVKSSKEVFIENLIGPGSISLGHTFELRVILRSNINNTVHLKLFRDRDYLSEAEIKLLANKSQVFSFKQKLDKEGTYTYEVIIEPEFDTIMENNRSKVLVVTTGKPKILYISPDTEQDDYLYRVLIQKGFDVLKISEPSSMPTSITELQNYSSVIFNNTPAYTISEEQMKMIKSYVHDLGGGFAMIGGENSFGSGGYYKTPIEDVLPVKMIPERKKRSLAIVLAIDKSGSMVLTNKINLAKEAATSVVEFLTEKDQIGIIAFDAEAEAVVRLEKVVQKGKIEDSIATIRAGGGTNIYPAIEMAYGWLRNADTQLKHLILVSDGRSQKPESSYALIKEMAQDKITISSIAIGEDADGKTMKTIADMGMGRYYETYDAGNLPRLFIKEAFMASELIMEGVFRPIISEESEILAGINQLPPLRGYIGTSLKDNTSLLIKSDMSDTSDPILATWQYGLGKSLAFTSDTKSKWAIDWLRWGDFSKFWSQAISWTLAIPAGEFDASTSISGGKGKITINALDAEGRYRNFLEFQAKVVRPDLSSEIIPINQSGSGIYEGQYNADQTGTYLAHISEMKDGKILYSQNTGAVTPYSPEYSDLETNYSLLENLASATGGVFKPSAEEITTHNQKGIREMHVIWQWLVLACVPLFFLDIIIRRITISKEQLKFLRVKLKTQDDKEKIQQHISFATRKPIVPDTYLRTGSGEPHTSRLLTAKKRARQSKVEG